MKKILLVLILLSIPIFAQSGMLSNQTVFRTFGPANISWESKWVLDTVLFEGQTSQQPNGDMITIITSDCCNHDWVKKDVKPKSYVSCYVLHDPRGCPNTWGLEEWICRKCLRHVRMKEVRVFVKPPKSEFDQLKEKIGKLKNAK